jgi:hypothetical protein
MAGITIYHLDTIIMLTVFILGFVLVLIYTISSASKWSLVFVTSAPALTAWNATDVKPTARTTDNTAIVKIYRV